VTPIKLLQGERVRGRDEMITERNNDTEMREENKNKYLLLLLLLLILSKN
jgi:hypothetical protein